MRNFLRIIERIPTDKTIDLTGQAPLTLQHQAVSVLIETGRKIVHTDNKNRKSPMFRINDPKPV